MSAPKLPIFQRTLDQAIAEAVEIVLEAKAEHKPSRTFLLYSGGNDSQVLLHMTARLVDEIVHVDTGIGIDGVGDFCRAVASKYPVPYTEEKAPEGEYERNVFGYWNGFPGMPQHGPAYYYLKDLQFRAVLRRRRRYRGERFLLLTGVRAAESPRRKKIHPVPVERRGGSVWVNPLLWFDNDEMREYRQRFDVVQSEIAANLHKSGECMCGAMTSQGPEREDRGLIRFFYPDFDRRLTDLERECESRGLWRCEWGVSIAGDKPDDGLFAPACQSCAWRQETFDLEGAS